MKNILNNNYKMYYFEGVIFPTILTGLAVFLPQKKL